MGLGRRVIVSLVLMTIVTMSCVKATIAEEAVKDKSWTDWAKEKIGLKHEENMIPTTHTTTTVQDNTKDVAKRKTEEAVGSVKDKASQSYDSAGQVKDDLSHKSKQVKDSLSWIDWAKEKIGIKHDENYPNVGDTVSEKAKDTAKRKAGDAKERLEETVEAAKEKVSDLTSAAKEKAEKLKEEAERESKNAKEKSKEHYESAKSKVEETLESAKDKASQSYDSAAKESEKARDTLSHKSKRVKDTSLYDDDDEL